MKENTVSAYRSVSNQQSFPFEVGMETGKHPNRSQPLVFLALFIQKYHTMRYQIPEYRTCKEGYYRLDNELNEGKMLYYTLCKYYKVNIVKNLRLNI